MRYGRMGAFALAVSVVLAPAVAMAGVPDDATLQRRVKRALAEDPRTSGADIAITVQKGVVTLRGSAFSLAQKRFAKAQCMKLAGVVGLIDALTVPPSKRSDFGIELSIKRSLAHGVSVRDDLGVRVKAGVVTLSGQVTSWEQVEEAVLLAEGVRGVLRVENLIEVAYQDERSDPEILGDVRSAFLRDVYLSSLPIQVKVEGRVVHLTGSVGSLFLKKRAASAALWIDSVRSVENEIEVRWVEDRGERTAPVVLDDARLRDAVLETIRQDDRIRSRDIEVEAKAGHVTLRGSVPSTWEARLAQEDAFNTLGTAWISNRLSVQAPRREDWAIASDISFELEVDSYLSNRGIRLSVARGVATISGTVPTLFHKARAGGLVRRVSGVQGVINNIQVKAPEFSDVAIRSWVHERLRANAQTVWFADEIQISVEEAVVTLGGEVFSFSDRAEAGRVAWSTPGVQGVNNNLTTEGWLYPWGDWTPWSDPWWPHPWSR